MDNKIILTAPHAYCFDIQSNIRNCDKRSEELLNCLKESLENHNATVITIINRDLKRIRPIDSTINNPVCYDYNRIPCRNSKFRNEIKQSYSNNDISYLLDCHSYPFTSSFTSYDNKELNNYDTVMVFLLNDIDTSNQLFIKCSILSYKINNLLYKLNKKCIILKGGENDIINESIKDGTNAFLIEVIEDHDILKDETLKLICDVIAEHVINYKLKNYRTSDELMNI